MSTKASVFPAYAEWLSKYCDQHDDVFVRDSWRMIDYCFQLDQTLPNEYGWRFSSEESLKAQVEGVSNPATINQIYWTDQARNIEAYSMTTFWRGVELLKPAIRSLNIHEIITPAVLSRSLLELSCVFLVHANNLEKAISELEFLDGGVVVSHELEEMIVKMIWGTRYGDPQPHLTQKNVLGFIQKISKNSNASSVQDTYDYLCDIAHPSFIGNTRFWSHVDKLNEDGSESRIIARYSTGTSTNEILDKIIWSLGWSAAVLRNSFEITASGLRAMLAKTYTGEQDAAMKGQP